MGVNNDRIDGRLVALAERTYAVARGSVSGKLPDHLALAWLDLSDAERTLYVSLVKAGYDACGNL